MDASSHRPRSGSRRLGEGGIGLPDSGGRRPAPRPTRGGGLRHLWENTRGGLLRAFLVLLGIWALYHMVGGRSGVLNLYSLTRTEAALESEYTQMEDAYRQVMEELNEDPGIHLERAMREKYNRSLPGEIVYRIERGGPADSNGVVRDEAGSGEILGDPGAETDGGGDETGPGSTHSAPSAR